MKNVVTGILCSLFLVLTACGGGGGGSSGNTPKSSTGNLSSAPVSSASVVESSSNSSAAVSSAGVSSAASSIEDTSSSVVSTSSTSTAASSTPGAGTASSIASSQDASSVASSQDVSSVASSQAVSSSSVASSIVASSAVSLASSSSSSTPVVVQTGVFVDSAVAGVAYQTSPGNFSGVTSATGQYQFAEGDTVIFSIGAIEFPPVTAKGVVTPVDMAASGNPADQIVVNIAVLLQSLDADGDPGNGISIPAAAVTAAVQNVTFNQPYSSFANEVLPVVQHTDTNKAVVSEASASAHLAESLEQVNASLLVGTWYIQGEDYQYALFILDDSHYAAIDNDISLTNGTALETGTYEWNQETGVVTLSSVERTDSDLDAEPPMANGNTLQLDGNELKLTDADESFVLHRLIASDESPLKGGWTINEEDSLVVFAFTGTHYLMGQQSEADENGWPGAEVGTYSYNTETGAVLVDTGADTNGQWGLSHSCAIVDGTETPNDLSCGPGGRDVVQTFKVTGDTLAFISEADTIANGGDEEEVLFEHVNGLPDGDIHLKLELTLTLTEYSQGQRYERENGTMQCDLDAPREVGEVEMSNESWVLGNNPNRPTWVSTLSASYNPETKVISFDKHEAVAPIPNHAGFYHEFWDTLEATYNAGESHVITGTYTEKYNLTWDRGTSDVSTCEATYSVIGVLR